MPVDSSIALSYRPVEIQNPLASYAQMMQIQNAQNQNSLAKYQLSKAQRDEEGDAQADSAWKGALGPDGQVDRSKLFQNVPGRMISGLMEKFQKLDKDQLAMMKEQLSISGGALASIAANPTRQSAFEILAGLKAMGVPGMDKAIASIPQNDAQVKDWVRYHASTTDHTLKALQAFQPQMEYKDVGGSLMPVQKNALAGPVGPGGAPMIQKTESPDSIATRAVTVRGQNMVDARSREAAAVTKAEKPPAGYRFTADGNLEAIPGGPALKPPTEYLKQQSGVENVRSAIKDYREALKTFGNWDALTPDERAKMGTIYNNVLLQGKEAYNLGVLNGPDYMILQQVITDPASMKGMITSKKALDAQAKKLDALMGRVGEGSAKAHGQPIPGRPKIGAVQDGYLFKGGDPANPSSWERVK